MKFGIDNRTGQFVPKKDENIYFGGSQGGGLIVDDKKNNVKFIVEMDGTITWLFSTRKDTHLYDIRDARIIADKVMRKFGKEHKYTDYKAFARNMKAVWESMVPTFEEFLNECGCKDYVECWNKLPAKTKPVFEKIFELFYGFPVYTSTFIALHLTFATGRTINILPCEIKMLNALDIFKPKVFQDDDSLGEKCFAIILPDGYTNLYAPSGFSDKISALSKELAEKFEKSGYVNMRNNVPDSIIRGYSNVGVSVFVKKKK